MDEHIEEDTDPVNEWITLEEFLAYHQQNATPTLQRNESMNVPTDNAGRPEIVGTHPDSEDKPSDFQTASLFAKNTVESNRIGPPMTTPTEDERSARMPTSISSPTRILERWRAVIQPSTFCSNDSRQHSTSHWGVSRRPLRSHGMESHQPSSQLVPQQLTRNFDLPSQELYSHQQIQNRHHYVMRTEMNSPTRHPYFHESPLPFHLDDSSQHSTSQQEFIVPQHLTRNISIPSPGLYSHRPIQNRNHDVMRTEMNSPISRQRHFSKINSSNFGDEYRSDRVSITQPSSSSLSQANLFGTPASDGCVQPQNEYYMSNNGSSRTNRFPGVVINSVNQLNTIPRCICPKCGKQFKFPSSLKQHIRLRCHNNEKQFQCRFCVEKFIQEHHLQIHELITHCRARQF